MTATALFDAVAASSVTEVANTPGVSTVGFLANQSWNGETAQLTATKESTNSGQTQQRSNDGGTKSTSSKVLPSSWRVRPRSWLAEVGLATS